MATIQSIKEKIQGLINKSNEATGGNDTDLTTAIDTLISNQGGGGAVKEKAVNFWDYDGTLLYSYTLAEARALTSLPELPTYEDTRFYASGWTITLANLQAVEGFEEITVKLTSNDTTYPQIALFVVDMCKTTDNTMSLTTYKRTSSYKAVIDWGDGTTRQTIGSTSATTYSHAYTERKKYTIILMSEAKSGSVNFGNGTESMFIPSTVLKAIHTSSSYHEVSKYAFQSNYNLQFAAAYKTNDYMFASCFSLQKFIMMTHAETLSSYMFNYAYAIGRMSVSYPMSNMFQGTNNLTHFKCTNANNGGGIYSIPQGLKVLILSATSMMTYSANIPVGTLIYVRDELVDTYKANSKWSAHANYIFPLSEYTDE